MRVRGLKKDLTIYIGLAATLLFFGLFFRWQTAHILTAHAFSDTVQGEILKDTEIEGGSIEDNDPAGFKLYYQIFNKEKKEVCISGYSYLGSGNVNLTFPAQILHGTEDRTPYKVVGINGGVFKNCSYLTGISFPDMEETYQWIGAEAFMNCPIYGVENVTSINFRSSLREIRERAFYGCQNIQTILIGPGVASIGNGAFANCPRLTKITVDGGNRNYFAEGGVLYSKDRAQLVQWPAGLTNGNAADGNCVIGSADFPVRVICARAFEGCWAQNYNMPMNITDMYQTVTTIGERAFYGCYGLQNVKIPNTVQSIEEEAFGNRGSGLVINCNKASQAELYANSHGIPTRVTCTVRFYDGNSLIKTEEVTLGGSASAPVLNERTGYTLTWDKDYTNVQQNLDVRASWKQNFTVTFKDSYSGQVSQVMSYFGGSATPPNWTRQGYVLAWDSTAYTYVTKDLTINAVWLVSMTGGTVTEDKPKVGDTRTINYITYQVTKADPSNPRVKAVNCTKRTLTSLTIPDTITFGGLNFKVTNIGVNAFRDMPSLKKLSIGKHVMKINRAAFYNCPKLKTIVIHSKKLDTVSDKAFKKTHVNAKVNVPNSYIKKYKKLLLDGGLSTYAKVY